MAGPTPEGYRHLCASIQAKMARLKALKRSGHLNTNDSAIIMAHPAMKSYLRGMNEADEYYNALHPKSE